MHDFAVCLEMLQADRFLMAIIAAVWVMVPGRQKKAVRQPVIAGTFPLKAVIPIFSMRKSPKRIASGIS